jgi:hypothetical protein
MPKIAQDMLERAVGMELESRFIGESRWWPSSIEEAACILGAYAPSLDEAFAGLCNGKVVASPISEFRFVKLPDSMLL